MAAEKEALHSSPKWLSAIRVTQLSPEAVLLTRVSLRLVAFLAVVVFGLSVSATAQEATSPSESTDDSDGFLCDDAVFVVHGGIIWLYYKGFAGQDLDGSRIRVRKNTFLLTASADKPPFSFF